MVQTQGQILYGSVIDDVFLSELNFSLFQLVLFKSLNVGPYLVFDGIAPKSHMDWLSQ